MVNYSAFKFVPDFRRVKISVVFQPLGAAAAPLSLYLLKDWRKKALNNGIAKFYLPIFRA